MRWSSSRSSGRLFGTMFLALVGHQAAGPRIPQPACRGRLSQGTGLWRGRCRAAPTRRRSRAVRQCAPELFPALFPLHVLQRRALSVPADGQHLRNADPGPTIVAGKITLGALKQISNAFEQVRRRSSIWSIPGRRSSSCSRSTSACARSRRRSRARRCRISTSAIMERQKANLTPADEPALIVAWPGSEPAQRAAPDGICRQNAWHGRPAVCFLGLCPFHAIKIPLKGSLTRAAARRRPPQTGIHDVRRQFHPRGQRRDTPGPGEGAVGPLWPGLHRAGRPRRAGHRRLVGWQYWTETRANKSGDDFSAALLLANDGKNDEALAALEALEKDGYGAYPLLARMRAATVLFEKGDFTGAVAGFDEVAERQFDPRGDPRHGAAAGRADPGRQGLLRGRRRRAPSR